MSDKLSLSIQVTQTVSLRRRFLRLPTLETVRKLTVCVTISPNDDCDQKPLEAFKYDTDKAEHSHYLRNYEDYFGHLADRDICLLELGVYHGGSLQLWRDYFEQGLIVGLDLKRRHD